MGLSLRQKTVILFLCLGGVAKASIPPGSQSSEPTVRVKLKTDQSILQHAFKELKYSNQKIQKPGVVKLGCRGQQVWLSIDGVQQIPVSVQKVEVIQGYGPTERKITVSSVRGMCQEVMSLPMEEYLVGVVSKEMAPNWPKESLKAQAIASRSYALYQMKERAKSDYDLESTVLDQVFEYSSQSSPWVRDAVEQTRGQILGVLKKKKFESIKAFYHSTCGGHTELPEQVWGKAFSGLKKSARCPYCYQSPRMNWKETFTSAELQKKLGSPNQSMTELKILPRYASSRLSGVAISWKSLAKNSPKEWVELIPLDLFRHKVGTDKVRSNWFQLIKTSYAGEPAYELSGQGFGHGVGMCQWGARGMALQGRDYRQILSLYYPDANLKKIW